MKLTLHVGHYKTGSTAIQTHFDNHRGAYRRRGLLYPANGKPLRSKANHSALAYQELHAEGQPNRPLVSAQQGLQALQVRQATACPRPDPARGEEEEAGARGAVV